MNEIIVNKKDVNEEIFSKYFKYQNPFFFSAKNLSRASQAKNECLVYNIIDGLIDLRKAIFRKKFLKVKIQIK